MKHIPKYFDEYKIFYMFVSSFYIIIIIEVSKTEKIYLYIDFY